MLGEEGTHFLDETHERLEGLVILWEDEGRVDCTTREVSVEDGEDLFANFDADVFLSFDC